MNENDVALKIEKIGKFWITAALINVPFSIYFATSIADFFLRIAVISLVYFIIFIVQGYFIISKARKEGVKFSADEEDFDPGILSKHREELTKRSKQSKLADLDPDELNLLLENANFAPAATVTYFEKDLIGRYMDEEIYDVVYIQDPMTGVKSQFEFYSCAPSSDPTQMPDVEGKILALVGHILYAKVEDVSVSAD